MKNPQIFIEKELGLEHDTLMTMIRFLKEDYGIDVIDVLTEDLDDHKDISTELLRLNQQAEQNTISVKLVAEQPQRERVFYVPRKIGTPRGFPPNMRRRK